MALIFALKRKKNGHHIYLKKVTFKIYRINNPKYAYPKKKTTLNTI